MKLQSMFFGAEECCELDGYLDFGECGTTTSDNKVLVIISNVYHYHYHRENYL